MQDDRYHTVMATYSFWFWSTEHKHTFTFRTNKSGDALYNELCEKISKDIVNHYPNTSKDTRTTFVILNFSDLGY